jgi:alanyl-tRNA synthetase
MDRKQLIKKYVNYFKKQGHKEILNSSLIPENDPTVLFTTAGMHPLIPFLMGRKHPSGKRLVNVQRCIRTGDIEEVGDETHHTFFEMLGNWSLGDYWKKDAIKYTYEFLTKELGIPHDRLAVSCFKGERGIDKDTEAASVWKELGFDDSKIAFFGREDNWWGPAGKTGPCGPDTEIFYWKSNKKVPAKFDVDDDNWVEIGNDVLMQYIKDEKGNYNDAEQKTIDFGGGVERMVMTLNGLEDGYLAEHFKPLIDKIEELSGKKYENNKKPMRIIADHIKAAVFIIADGIVPGNSEQGYILRRLIRRAVRHGKKLGLVNFLENVAGVVFDIYDDYKHLKSNKKKILEELEKEENKFLETLDKGIRNFEKITKDAKKIDGRSAFLLYQSYGFPIEMILELAKEKRIKVDEKGFKKENKKHQELSRTASKGRFASGLADSGLETTRLHTATHLLHTALREVLGDSVQQKGSNITPDRLRFDFSFDRKMTDIEKKKVENLVNGAISKKLDVSSEEMSPKEAKKSGALGFFGEKYGDKVSVYTVKGFSKEICTGPHVKNTSELGKFKIKKEESSSSGVRRIKGVLE